MKLCAWLFPLLLLGCAPSEAPTYDLMPLEAVLRELDEANRGGVAGPHHLSIPIGHGGFVTAVVKATSKGNGGIEIGRLRLRIWDQHEDLATFSPPMLDVRCEDRTGDGWLDLVLEGRAQLLGEEGEPLGSEPISCVYAFDPRKVEFVVHSEVGGRWVRLSGHPVDG